MLKIEPERGQSFLDKRAAELFNDEQPEAQDWAPNLSSEIDYMIPFPCLAQDIQKWIISTSIKVQPALAFMATLSVLAVVTGRDVQVSGIKGTLLFLGMAGSGEGKDWPLKAASKLLDSVGMGHHVYSEMASGAALVDAIKETPSALLAIDEVGHYFASINSKTSNQFSREIMPIITKCYTSGSDYYQDKSRKGALGEKIVEPNLNVLGMTTERQIMDNLKTSEVADGSLARFMVLFGENCLPLNENRLENTEVPATIKSRLDILKGPYFMLRSKEIVLNDDYKKRKREIEHYFNEKAINVGRSGTDKAEFKSFYHRLAVRAVSMSLLLDYCNDIKILDWCANLVEKSTDVFIKKFAHMAADNETEKFVKTIERAIKEAGKNGLSKTELHNKTKSVESGLKRRILNDLIESGLVFTLEDSAKTKPITRFYWRK